MKKIIIFLIIFIVGILLPTINVVAPNPEGIYKLRLKRNKFNLVDSNIYGNTFNFNGNIEEKFSNLTNVSLVFYQDKIIDSYDLIYKYQNNKLLINSSNLINVGINLDKLVIGEYTLLIKVSFKDKEDIYYTFSDNNLEEFNYYTITNDGKNNLINFTNNQDPLYENFTNISIKETTLPDDVYDIVIDPGHGYSIDLGASYGEIHEGPVVYKIATETKKELEELGYKVFMTRNETDNLANYGSDGRIKRAFESHAKIYLSIHANSSYATLSRGGVEVYTPNSIDFTFASKIANNIVNSTRINYSVNGTGKHVAKGVFQRLFTNAEIRDAASTARKKGYKPYNQTTNTPYYFMIRESGGKVTGAYVDGRNEKKELNPYYKSNVGMEAYLLELGYLNVTNDRNKLLNNVAGYATGIANGVKSYLNS